jgi:hypothetical protein
MDFDPLAYPLVCPKCNTDDIEMVDDNIEEKDDDDLEIICYVECLNEECGFKWREIYRFIKWLPKHK